MATICHIHAVFSIFQKNRYMFSFLNKVNARSVVVPSFDWRLDTNEANRMAWINPLNSCALSVNYHNVPPNLPNTPETQRLLECYRMPLANANGGIIEVGMVTLHEIPVVKTIFKLPQQPSGTTYLASLTVPFKTCSYVIKLQCAEVGNTGLRDAQILNRMMADGTVTMGNDGLENWFVDPYDPTFKGGIVMNRSELEVYDSEFPFHPLSKARSLLTAFTRGITFKPEIKKLHPLYNL
jgi:hypothetical protein